MFKPEIADALRCLLPTGYELVVKLTQEDGRKKRGTASASNWKPDTDRIVIYFERSAHASETGTPSSASASQSLSTAPDDPDAAKSPACSTSTPLQQIQECCDALAEVEKAGRPFIAFKWFRDEALPKTAYPWAIDAEQRQRILAQAIELKAVRTSKIPNPKHPQFSTTTVAVNRGSQTSVTGSRFRPITIQGEPISNTIMRDRGSL